ncbi:iron chelate uptake ABC transporter family permease subunit [Leifsonia sp. LS1]|uniref:FecCD family ABC transporter permease n=1 Tax=Leifsonia sp. LS1 TaxID=2828483 RepID=UPI001CFF426E|nr:iron chelate uptake ABC transporter family permease subunit [Leifsonia sp. LS1]
MTRGAPPEQDAVFAFDRPQVVLRGRGLSVRLSRRVVITVAVLTALAVIVAVLSLGTGSYALSPAQVVEALIGRAPGIAHTIVVDWRLPRVLVAALFGIALGLAGSIFQSLTRNPLGSPDVIGFDTGAYTGALVVMLALHGSSLGVTAGAITGGLATATVVYLLAHRRGMHGFRLIVVGIGTTAMLTSVNTWMLLTADTQEAVSAAFWGAGSLDTAGYPQLALGAVVFVVLFPLAAAVSRGLGQLELGDDAGAQLGVAVERTRITATVVGVALSATVTALAGPIAFVALSAPQIARRLAGTAGPTLGVSAATGGVLLMSADWIAQHGLPTPVPVGLVTVVLGGGYFVWLLIAEGRRR